MDLNCLRCYVNCDDDDLAKRHVEAMTLMPVFFCESCREEIKKRQEEQED